MEKTVSDVHKAATVTFGPKVSDFTDPSPQSLEEEASNPTGSPNSSRKTTPRRFSPRASIGSCPPFQMPEEVVSRENSVAFKGSHGPSIGLRFKWEQLSLRADVQDTYSVCSALLTGFCVCAQHISEEQVAVDGKGDNPRFYALCAQQFLLRLATIMGTYSTLIFMLSAMYMKTSLSRPVYGVSLFQVFTDKTSDLRRSAFNSMCGAFATFGVSVVLSLFYSFTDKVAALLCIPIIVFVVLLLCHGSRMLDDAQILFVTDEEQLDQLLFASKESIDDDVLLEAENERESLILHKSMRASKYQTMGSNVSSGNV